MTDITTTGPLAAFGFTMDVTSWLGFQRDDDGWEHYGYEVRLTRHGQSMTVPFRMGTGLVDEDLAPREPSLSDVLQSLSFDAQIVTNDELDDVLGDMPFSKARKIAEAMEAQTSRLRRLLGRDFETFINHDWET